MGRDTRELVDRIRPLASRSRQPWAIHGPDGAVFRFGIGEPTFELVIANDAGLRAIRSLSELAFAEAYIRGELDVRGDLLSAMELRHLVSDRGWLVMAWAHLQPLLTGRIRSNPGWIAKHYDTQNVQVLALDDTFAVYTPGIYESDDDTMEAGAERKLATAFEALRLAPGLSLLDVGCGWGGFARYCASRGVEVTGITLSRHQLEYSESRLKADGLEGSANLLYQDFFTFQPARQFDAISMMGVIEDLSDYDLVMQRVVGLLRPDARVYCDFASANRRFGVPSFVTKHVWPGKFRMVYMPQFMKAVAHVGLDIVELHNDRHNYYLWTRAVHERWVARHDLALEIVDERTWRLMRLLMAGTAQVMGPTSTKDTAYRVVLGWRNPSRSVSAVSGTTDRGGARSPLFAPT